MLASAKHGSDGLDRLESLKALSFVDREGALSVIEGAKHLLRKDGSMPHSSDQTEPGSLESAVLLQAVSAYLLLARDKKLTRSLCPILKKLAFFLLASSKEYSLRTKPTLPQGWRRSLGRGYPAGKIPEISLAAAGGLAGAAQVARQVAKADDAGRFRERADMLTEMVRKRLVD